MNRWLPPLPSSCNLCNSPLTTAFVDGKTRNLSDGRGSWAIMCPRCFALYGVGLGTGKGQLYDVATGKKVQG